MSDTEAIDTKKRGRPASNATSAAVDKKVINKTI